MSPTTDACVSFDSSFEVSKSEMPGLSVPLVIVNTPSEEGDSVIAIEPDRRRIVEISIHRNSNHQLRGAWCQLEAHEKGFGAESEESKKMRELTEQPVRIANPPSESAEVAGGFDVCREYGYKYEYEDDQQDDEDHESSGQFAPHRFNVPLLSMDVSPVSLPTEMSSSQENTPMTYILGRVYDPLHDYAARRQDESTLFWFTYRCDFPPLSPYPITSDAGWGCMLRSAQMLLGQALRLHFRSRDWRPPQSTARKRQDQFLRSIMTWFADFPSSSDCVYSLHNMVAAGLSKYEILPGEWYGPGTACYVLRDLVQLHEQQQADGSTKLERPLFRVYVASQGTIYRDAVQDLMTKNIRVQLAKELEKKKKPSTTRYKPAHPLDFRADDNQVATADLNWDTGLLLLVPLRLGLKAFNADYIHILSHMFSLPQSVGALGGRPRGARWFYGAMSDGSKIFGLDPHTVQNAPRRRRNMNKNGHVVDLSEEYLRSVHTSYPEIFSLERMDPSLAVGFYCRDRSAFENLIKSIRHWRKANADSPELFSVCDTVPDYSASVTSAMSEMMLSSSTSQLEAGRSLLDEEVDDASDEDEYVML